MNPTNSLIRRQVPTPLSAALAYAARGWSLIPIKPGTKTPACQSWKQYQTTPADDKLLRRWFADGKKGVAVVCGRVSAGLVIRDFDDMGAYDRWAQDHPELARSLPTVATSRGRHVYFLADCATVAEVARHVDLATLMPEQARR